MRRPSARGGAAYRGRATHALPLRRLTTDADRSRGWDVLGTAPGRAGKENGNHSALAANRRRTAARVVTRLGKPAQRVIDELTGRVVGEVVRRAAGPWQSLKGLMFVKELPAGHGMLFRPAQGIHTHFMRFP